jgi:hypothetical protein
MSDISDLMQEIASLSPADRALLEEKLRNSNSFSQQRVLLHENNVTAENLALKIIALRREGFNVKVIATDIYFSSDDRYDNHVVI